MADMRQKIGDATDKAPGAAEEAGHQARGAAPAVGDKAKQTTSGVVGAARGQVQDAAAGASQLAAKAKDKAQERSSLAGGAALQVRDKAQEATSAVAEKVGDLAQGLAALIRRHPLPALLVGAGVGFLIGQVLRRSSSRRG